MRGTARFTGHYRHVATPIVAFAALLCAVPRPAFYAHHHAGDGAGHVHAAADARSHPHHHDYDPGHDHDSEPAHSHRSVRDPVFTAGSPTTARDHWHVQAPFQHAAVTLPGTDAHFERVTLVVAASALTPSRRALPTPRSRGPPLLPPTR